MTNLKDFSVIVPATRAHHERRSEKSASGSSAESRDAPSRQLRTRNAVAGPPPSSARPLFIGPRNAEAVTGQAWRWCRDHARAWGVPILRVDAKPLIRTDEFAAALEAHAEPDQAASPADDATELEAMRRQLGKRRRTSNPTVREEIAAESRAYRSPLPRRMPPERE
jgi:hypothetical protein